MTIKQQALTRARCSASGCSGAASWASATPTRTRRSRTSIRRPASCRGFRSSATRMRRRSSARPSATATSAAAPTGASWSADPEIDVVDNCGPDPVHPEPCIAALQNGKHVICEKPMAISVADARRMRDAAAAARGKAMCTFNYRFLPGGAAGQGPDRLGQAGDDLPHPHPLPADGRARSLHARATRRGTRPGRTRAGSRGSAATPSTSAASWSARSRASPPWCGRSTRTGPFPRPATRRVVSDEGAAAVLDFENGAIGVLESSVVATGPQELPRLGDQRLEGLAALGPGAPQQPVRLHGRRGRQRPVRLHRNLGHRELPPLRRRRGGRRATTSAGSTATSSRSSTSSTPWPTTSR